MRFFLIFVQISLVYFLTGCEDDVISSNTPTIDVGIFNGRGVFSESVTALKSAIEHYNYETEFFDESDVFRNEISRYRVIVFPGGDSREYSVSLSQMGRDRIKNYVDFGGAFIGFGGGAAVADTQSGAWQGIGLFFGDAFWPIDRISPYPEYAMTSITKTRQEHQITRGMKNDYVTMYRWGPEFNAGNPLGISELYLYELTLTPAVIAYRFGAGRVVLSGVQLEFEENSDRDNSDFGSNEVDPESEWELINQILEFCSLEN